MRLLLFNPETEYALASGASFYTPPKQVVKLREENQLLPEAWASEEDYILVDRRKGLKSKFRLVEWGDLKELIEENPNIIIEPWGWNPALVRRLMDNGVPASKLPDPAYIAKVRQLAHRRTTIAAATLWNESAELCHQIDVPVELSSIEDCMRFYKENPGCWMKAPWSSSGRGVINTAADMSEDLVEQWCRGILRRQGNVMGETGADRLADYATEWEMKDGKLEYLGLSSFSTSNRGKYISNHLINQAQMIEKFNSSSKLKLENLIERQKKILEVVLNGYEGLMGVDMIVEKNGNVRPFVEINLRRTMGMLHIIR